MFSTQVMIRTYGNEIELTCEGVDEQEALDHLVAAIDSGLGE